MLVRQKNRRSRFVYAFNIVFGGVLIAATALLIPIYSEFFEGADFPKLKTVLLSIINAARMFALEAEMEFFMESLGLQVSAITPLYTVYMILLLAKTPVRTRRSTG